MAASPPNFSGRNVISWRRHEIRRARRGGAIRIFTRIRRSLPILARNCELSGLTTDGTSRAYTSANEAVADAGLAAALVATATRVGIAVVPVKIATVDALFCETPADVHRWVALGAQAINMETTPLYAAASMCGLRAVWLGHISDTLSLTTATWDSWQRPAAMTEETVALTIGFLERSA